ncbi:MAG: hypothetical protein ACI4NR_04045 [Megasphaera sp.]|uniref:hypothetical protein n=1 Tax=Megasphaera sp. TaxID=2023260 RepID=UPI003F0C666E
MEGESKLYDYKIIHHNDNTGEPEVILESSDQALALEFFLILLLTTMVGFYTRVYYKKRSDEKALRHFINDSDEALSVVARDGSEVFMSNSSGATPINSGAASVIKSFIKTRPSA